MARRKKHKSQNPNAHLFVSTNSYHIPETNRIIEFDEIIKIHGEHGKRFKFKEHVVKTDTGVEWINCIQIEKGVFAGWRSFRPERIKPLPRKRQKKNAA